MKKIISTILLIFSIVLLYAQDYPIDTIKGKAVYNYSVQKSEGLYRISKNFGVTQEEIIKWNPEIAETGLRVGQKILIPVVETIDSTQYDIHTIAAKETLWGLSRQFGTTVAKLQELNPETSIKMQIGSKLLIPKKEFVTLAKAVVKDNKEIDSLATDTSKNTPQFVVVKPIKDNKEEAENHQLKIDEAAKDNLETNKQDIVYNDSIFNAHLSQIKTEQIAEDTILPTDSLPIRIAFLLPFMTETLKRDATIDRFIEFYEGALIAIYDAQKHGQKFEIYTYDIDKTESHLQATLDKPELLNVDFIIGPAYSNQVELVSNFAKSYKKNVIIPFTSNINSINDNPYLWQFNTTHNTEEEAINTYLKQNNIQRIKLNLDLFTSDTLTTILSDTCTYLFDIQTSSWGDIERIMPQLEVLKKTYNFYLLSRYSWQNNNIQIPTLYTSVFSNNNVLKRTGYELSYSHYFHHKHAYETPRYDILGYDITMFMIRHYLKGDMQYSGIRSNMNFEKATNNGGYINTELQIITTK